jgi:hypothetical protein
MDVQNLTDGIIAVSGTPDGEKALTAIFGSNWSGVDNVLDSVYDPLRELVKTFGFQLANCYDMYLPFVTRITSK